MRQEQRDTRGEEEIQENGLGASLYMFPASSSTRLTNLSRSLQILVKGLGPLPCLPLYTPTIQPPTPGPPAAATTSPTAETAATTTAAIRGVGSSSKFADSAVYGRTIGESLKSRRSSVRQLLGIREESILDISLHVRYQKHFEPVMSHGREKDSQG